MAVVVVVVVVDLEGCLMMIRRGERCLHVVAVVVVPNLLLVGEGFYTYQNISIRINVQHLKVCYLTLKMYGNRASTCI